MKLSDIPQKIPTPFAEEAGAGFISTIPPSTSVPGRASWQTGFPPVNFEPIPSGGTPPYGQDMNGVLNAITVWLQWLNAGGTVEYDATFSSEIGGYPQGALLAAANGEGFWLCTVDDNTSNPDAGGAGWIFFGPTLVSNGNPTGSVAGTVGTSTSAPTMCWDYKNFVMYYCSQSGTSSTAKWLPVTPAIQVQYPAAAATLSYTRAMNGTMQVRSNGGSAMSDTLPDVSTTDPSWNVYIFNGDGTGILTLTAPTGKSLNGVLNGNINVPPGQSTQVTKDANGNYLCTVFPIPAVFSGQAIYVSANGSYSPGVYDIDTTGGSFDFTIETGGTDGDNYTFRDVGGALAIYPMRLIAPGGQTFEGYPSPMYVDVNWSTFTISRKSGNWSLA